MIISIHAQLRTYNLSLQSLNYMSSILYWCIMTCISYIFSCWDFLILICYTWCNRWRASNLWPKWLRRSLSRCQSVTVMSRRNSIESPFHAHNWLSCLTQFLLDKLVLVSWVGLVMALNGSQCTYFCIYATIVFWNGILKIMLCSIPFTILSLLYVLMIW